MSTTARPRQGHPRGRTPRVLAVSAGSVVAAVAVVTTAGGLASGEPGAYGALVGGGIALAFFVFGSAVVIGATRVAPQAALMMAVLTYTLQVAAVALAFAALSNSGVMEETLAPGWLAGGVIAATVAWTAGQLVATARARVPVYDIELPGERPIAPASNAVDASEPAPDEASQRREPGAP